MAFELSDFDHKLLKFGQLFKQRFMDIDVSIPLEQALDLGLENLSRVLRTPRVVDETGFG